MTLYSDEEITLACDGEDAAYARNKHRGGLNAQQGFAFEVACAAYALVVELDRELSGEGDDARIHVQAGGFVDDLVVEAGGHAVLSQLKSGPVRWEGGSHPLVDDFTLQATLDRYLRLSRSYELVVASADVEAAARAARPRSVQEVAVRTVAYEGPDLVGFADHNPEMIACLENLVSGWVTRSNMANAFKLVLGTLFCDPKPISVGAAARSLCGLEDGPIVASRPSCFLADDVQEILDGIPELKVILAGARPYYTFGEIKGSASWLHGSRKHRLFEEWVRRRQPNGYEGAWETLGMLRQGD